MADKSHLVLTHQGDVTIVGFKEPTILDAYHVKNVSEQLYDLIDKDNLQLIVLDFSTIKMLSSQTLSILLKMREKLDAIEGKMVISGIEPSLYRVVKITNLENIFSFFNDTDTAVKSLQ